MPVLYGVLMYMGIASLKGMQFIDRIFIMFMPQKYQPDYIYLRNVQLKKVHIFTAIQVCKRNHLSSTSILVRCIYGQIHNTSVLPL